MSPGGPSPDGTTSHWTWDCTAGRFRWYYEVDDYVRKQAVFRVPVPRAMRYAVKGIGRRKHRLR